MTLRESINTFFSSKNIAVVGVSGTGKGFGYTAYHKLKNSGFNVFPVNKNVTSIDGNQCYNSLAELQGKAEVVVMVIPPSAGKDVVLEASRIGIKSIWFQPGAESDELVKLAASLSMNVIQKECVIMFAEPVSGFHRFHRAVTKITGKYPK